VGNSPQLFEYLIQDLAVVLIAASLAGWLCRKLGLSVIVGYLGAGILVGTPQIAFPYVTDPARIQLLAQLGLVFLMFFIGLRLRLRKLKEIGFGVVLAVVVTALGTLTIARLGALLLGFDEATALFFAAMLMVSSSAIVGKLLQDNQLVHERSGNWLWPLRYWRIWWRSFCSVTSVLISLWPRREVVVAGSVPSLAPSLYSSLLWFCLSFRAWFSYHGSCTALNAVAESSWKPS